MTDAKTESYVSGGSDPAVAHVLTHFFEPALITQTRPMSEDQTRIMAGLLMGPKGKAAGLLQEMLLPPIREVVIAQNIAARFRRPVSPEALVFLLTLADSPGDVTMYLTFAQWRLREEARAGEEGRAEDNGEGLTLPGLAGIFPMGFWAREDLDRLWRGQKLPPGVGGPFADNGLDFPAVLLWLNADAPARELPSRAEHLAWCKARALAYVDSGDATNAFASMASDLDKHPETRGHGAIHLGMTLLMGGHLDAPDRMREFIEGFN